MYKKNMYIKISDEEFVLLNELLRNNNLNGLSKIIISQLIDSSPVNNKHTQELAIEAAKTYFSADDIIIGENVEWSENGDALVHCFQRVPASYIQEKDCGCGK
jgi:hypothetical protein